MYVCIMIEGANEPEVHLKYVISAVCGQPQYQRSSSCIAGLLRLSRLFSWKSLSDIGKPPPVIDFKKG